MTTQEHLDALKDVESRLFLPSDKAAVLLAIQHIEEHAQGTPQLDLLETSEQVWQAAFEYCRGQLWRSVRPFLMEQAAGRVAGFSAAVDVVVGVYLGAYESVLVDDAQQLRVFAQQRVANLMKVVASANPDVVAKELGGETV